jgi:methyl-accepting chemotaxis protein
MGEPNNNKWYNFFFQIVWAATGAKEEEFAKLKQCLPSQWLEADNQSISGEVAATQPKSTWTRILDGIQTLIEFVCRWKDNIVKLFARRTRRQQRRNKYRMLVQTYSSRMARYRRALGWWDDIKNAAKKALGAVTDWAKAKWEDLKNFGNDFIKNIALFWDNLKAKVVAFLNSDFVKFIKKFYECVMAAKGIVEAIVKVIKATVERVTQIATIAAGNLPELAKLFVDLICNFKDFREAINNLIDGIEEKETNKKYGLYGRFFGIFFKALTAKKMRRFRLKH